MGSYVISVSLCKGCYRHIQISGSAKLYRLHKTILKAFEFDDDHLHAFFMDNRLWSPMMAYMSVSSDNHNPTTKSRKLDSFFLEKGYSFKYLFDFGDEWVFQCKVLRVLDEDVSVPVILRSVGDPPPQYPDYDEYYEYDYPEYNYQESDEQSDTEEQHVTFPEIYSDEKCNELYIALPLPVDVVCAIVDYFQAAARLYGILSVKELFEIYNSQNEPVSQEDFLAVEDIIFHEKHIEYYVYGAESLYLDAEPSEPMEREIIAQHLVIDGPEDYYALKKSQSSKPLNILPREEFISYADPDYYPVTPQNTELRKYLEGKLKDAEAVEDAWLGLHDMVTMDFSLKDLMSAVDDMGIRFKTKKEAIEFLAIYQEFNNHTRKHVNRGYSPYEFYYLQTKKRKNVEGQIGLFE